MTETVDIIDAGGIQATLETAAAGKGAAREVLAAARDLRGLTNEQAATLMLTTDPEVEEELFETARGVRSQLH